MNLFKNSLNNGPSVVVKNDMKVTSISVKNPGYGRVLRSVAISFLSAAFTCKDLLPLSQLTPHSLSFAVIDNVIWNHVLYHNLTTSNRSYKHKSNVSILSGIT